MDHRDLVDFIDARRLFSRNGRILLAVSGGIDSVVLAHLFHRSGMEFALAHCNFGLRGKESEADANFVGQLAQDFSVPFFLQKFNTKTFAAKHGYSIQMAARELRYGWFEEIRRVNGFDCIATAHHLDDQAETFLINILRGTGIAGLHGIPLKNGHVVRPFMFAYRKDIELYASLNRVDFRIDRSNNETVYLRNKVRHEIIPILNAMNPDFPGGLTESIKRISDFEKIGNRTLDEWCRQNLKIDGSDAFIETEALSGADPVEPFAWRLLSPFGFNETQIRELLNCLGKPARKHFTSTSHRMVKDRKRIMISPITVTGKIKPVVIRPFRAKMSISKPFSLKFTRIRDVENYVIPSSPGNASLDFSKLEFPLQLRKWEKGDSFFPFGMQKRKKLSDFFTDIKFTNKEKEETWLLCSGEAIVWVVGHRIDHRFRITNETREILSVLTDNT
jgi:tRNA(Ile)-lysidine synthase